MRQPLPEMTSFRKRTAAIMSHDDVSRIRKEIDQLMAGSSVADRVLCEAIIKQAHLSVAYHLLTSPFIGVVTIPLTVIALGRLMMNVADIIVKWQPRRFQTLDGLFYRQGAALNT